MQIRIKKGLDIPLAGIPDKSIEAGNDIATVAVLGSDVHGLQPRMAVKVGERVKLGQRLFADKKNPAVSFTAPGCGRVAAINRGARRVLQSVVIELDGDEAETFRTHSRQQITTLDAGSVRDTLQKSGAWTGFRTRPFSHVPPEGQVPAAIFVTAIDTHPLAADPAIIIADAGDAFGDGLAVIARLTEGNVYLCTAPGAGIDCPDGAAFKHAEFEGPHPAGLPGTHIHHLEPVSEQKVVWHIGYQDVIAIGRLLTRGRLSTERIIALGGPRALRPRLVRTRAGASTKELLNGETASGRLRVISGSVLSGHQAVGPLAYLGRYHNQLSLLQEGEEREFLSWIRPGHKKYSTTRAYLGHLLHRNRFDMSTTQNGSPRAMVSIGTFERIMPLDILPTPLLKALLVEDTDRAKELGCLELDEDDLALCSFVCNGKYDYGPFLRMNLEEIEANG